MITVLPQHDKPNFRGREPWLCAASPSRCGNERRKEDSVPQFRTREGKHLLACKSPDGTMMVRSGGSQAADTSPGRTAED